MAEDRFHAPGKAAIAHPLLVEDAHPLERFGDASVLVLEQALQILDAALQLADRLGARLLAHALVLSRPARRSPPRS